MPVQVRPRLPGDKMKVRVDLDSCTQFYMQDEEVLSILDPDGYYKTIEVPFTLVAEYRRLAEENDKMQAILKKIYYENFRADLKTAAA
jgi:hypothetical protein